MEKKTKKKTIEQSGVRKGSPMEGVRSQRKLLLYFQKLKRKVH